MTEEEDVSGHSYLVGVVEDLSVAVDRAGVHLLKRKQGGVDEPVERKRKEMKSFILSRNEHS